MRTFRPRFLMVSGETALPVLSRRQDRPSDSALAAPGGVASTSCRRKLGALGRCGAGAAPLLCACDKGVGKALDEQHERWSSCMGAARVLTGLHAGREHASACCVQARAQREDETMGA